MGPFVAPVEPWTSPVDKGPSTSEAPGSATELPHIVGPGSKCAYWYIFTSHSPYLPLFCLMTNDVYFYRNKVHLEFFRVRVKYRIQLRKLFQTDWTHILWKWNSGIPWFYYQLCYRKIWPTRKDEHQGLLKAKELSFTIHTPVLILPGKVYWPKER